ncbi:DUF2537 domain-containing protein [Rhodococcus tukisamuensis]|uniref:DUF2537 domain-containing protein n=1 Tax=Rhodococcus tukisamuensis TaxID=168276 RepID=A0A1G6P897_9NOCA|nr:DUF2537 domain-containing protein [Rhodococcus tukisamuensis]SDC75605.1 Protein of unknown function [Rhodococcus tukisamuensis]
MTDPVGSGTPWGTGLVVAGFAALVAVVAVIACGAAMIEVHPLLAVVVNLVVAAGVAPTLWQWRATPVWRWLVYGTVAGVAAGWLALALGAR